MSSITELPSVWLQRYYDRGFRLLFYESGKKGPETPAWTSRSDTLADYKVGQNVGTFTGVEIETGKWLVDIDFDWPDGLPLAKKILPPTQFGFGRQSRTISHAFYTSAEPLPSFSFDNIDGKPLVEFRGTKQDGSIGLQTMLPPSLHPSGERIEVRSDGEIAHCPEIWRRTTLYAISCLLYSHLGHRGLLHDTRLAVAGFLLSEGLSKEETILIGEAIAAASGNNVEDVKVTVQTTASKIKAGDRVQGRGSLIKSLGEDGKKILSKIREWLGGREFKEDGKGHILANSQENVRVALDKLGVSLRYDVFCDKPIVEWPGHIAETPKSGNAPHSQSPPSIPLNDDIVRKIWFEIDEKFGFRPAKDLFFDIVQDAANRQQFHPVLDYLRSLRWDGIPRLDMWLIDAGKAANTDYVKAVSRIVLLAAVKRVTHPGTKYDEMLVLESGQQGLMKSTALRTLCPDEKWFSDDLPLNVDAKQIVERTSGKWIIEASDLSGMQASQVEHLKGMLSRQVDGPVRLAYGRLPVEQPRQFIIVGTTNSYTYLTDSTGNRRFWPVRVQQFDIPWIRENRDQIWAEAFARASAGESTRLDPSLYEHASLQQERRRAEDPWEVKLEEAFPKDRIWRLTVDEVWSPIGVSIDKRDARGQDRLLKAMHRLGFKRLSVKRDGKVSRGFARDEIDGQLNLSEES